MLGNKVKANLTRKAFLISSVLVSTASALWSLYFYGGYFFWLSCHPQYDDLYWGNLAILCGALFLLCIILSTLSLSLMNKIEKQVSFPSENEITCDKYSPNIPINMSANIYNKQNVRVAMLATCIILLGIIASGSVFGLYYYYSDGDPASLQSNGHAYAKWERFYLSLFIIIISLNITSLFVIKGATKGQLKGSDLLCGKAL